MPAVTARGDMIAWDGCYCDDVAIFVAGARDKA